MAIRALVAPALAVLAAGAALAAPAPSYDWIRQESLRAGYLSASDPRSTAAAMKAAGFNALLPKFGGLASPPDEASVTLLREWGEAAHQAGLRLLPVFNFRGGRTEQLLSARREVTASGQRLERTPCPLDEQFWRVYVLDRAVDLARRSQELHLTGCVLDPEMYGADHTVFEGACLCDDCLREFLKAAGLAVPDPLPAAAQRQAWLAGKQLEGPYEEHFVDRVTALSRQVEQAAHEANPDILLGVLLLDYPTPFMRGMARGFGTGERPVLGFSETTYPAGYTDYVEAQQKTFAGLRAHVLFVPGLWLAKFPTENLAEQCYACATHAAGYWVYTIESLVQDVTNNPDYALPEPNDRYWAAMTLANEELVRRAAAGDAYVSALRVRAFETPLRRLEPGPAVTDRLMPVTDATPLTLGPEQLPRLRYRNPLCILCNAGEPVEVVVSNAQLNTNYRARSQYGVFTAAGDRVTDGVVALGQSGRARWTPERDGLYVVLADSDQNGYTLQVTSPQPCALPASKQQPLTVNGALGRLYFHVPAGVAGFSVFLRAQGQAPGRGGRLAIHAPDGTIAARAEGDLGTLTELPVTAPVPAQGRVWAITGEDLTNDLVLYFSPDLPGWVATDPRRLLTRGETTHQ